MGSGRPSFSGTLGLGKVASLTGLVWQQSPCWAVITLGSERLLSSAVLSSTPALQSFSELLYISLKKKKALIMK